MLPKLSLNILHFKIGSTFAAMKSHPTLYMT